MAMNMNNVVYWHKNQVIVRTKTQPINTISTTIQEIFVQLNQSLAQASLPQLNQPFDTIVIQDPQHPDNAQALHFAQILSSHMGNVDSTIPVVSHLNSTKNTFAAKDAPQYDIVPHWLWSGTPDTIHGCPVSPPIPVEESGVSGLYKITLPQLPDPLQSATGKGVTVFVLDTLPSTDMIEHALGVPGNNNTLLKNMATGMKKEQPYNSVPPAINHNHSFPVPDVIDSAMTGKDIYGRLVGFPMADHGLAIAGIIRDLAPAANIECIRVLNDYAVGDVNSLAHALTYIYHRMLPYNPDTGQRGDLVNMPVVINLSLVVFPPETDIPAEVKDTIMSQSLDMLHHPMQLLAGQQAIFTASVGNDTDPRDTKMNPAEVRFDARYPAYFAYDKNYSIPTMIPVGAVNQLRKATLYSNYPGPRGIATYGGELPKPDPWIPSAMSHAITHIDTTVPIDAICGIYTAQLYPALSVNDRHPSPMGSTPMGNTPMSGTPMGNTTSPMGNATPGMSTEYPTYSAPNSSAWAYYSGTSFATPIISALVARVLEREPGKVDLPQTIISASRGQRTMWTKLTNGKDESGPIILAMQDWYSDDTSTM